MALRFALLTFALLSSLTTVSQEAQLHPITPYENSDAYEVYDALLPTDVARETSPLVISDETAPAALCLEPGGDWKWMLMQAMADYKKQNATTYRLQPKFIIKGGYKLIAKREIYARFKHPGEGSWVELSAVGFNRKRTIAVLWVSYGCPGLCGAGTFHVLRKKNGKWQPLDWKGASCIIAS